MMASGSAVQGKGSGLAKLRDLQQELGHCMGELRALTARLKSLHAQVPVLPAESGLSATRRKITAGVERSLARKPNGSDAIALVRLAARFRLGKATQHPVSPPACPTLTAHA
jgi:hypothetical protein